MISDDTIKKYADVHHRFVATGIDPAAAAELTKHVIETQQSPVLNQVEIARLLGVSRDVSDPLLIDGEIENYTIGRRRFALRDKVLEYCERKGRKPSKLRS